VTTYNAVMVDECGGEFGATVRARSSNEAYAKLREDYPESRCVQLDSPYMSAQRQRRFYQRVARMNEDY
jgi:UDP-N-acetyl-D-mannosaminuronic acid transferase (WecB/TagA/CpsF family)